MTTTPEPACARRPRFVFCPNHPRTLAHSVLHLWCGDEVQVCKDCHRRLVEKYAMDATFHRSVTCPTCGQSVTPATVRDVIPTVTIV
jgi:hypothetical protein